MNTAIQSSDTGRHSAAMFGGRESRYLSIIVPNGLGKWATLEVLVGMAVAIGLGYVLHPTDPLLMDSAYPWPWLLATIFALRYGALLGVLGGLCIMTAWWLLYTPPLFTIPTVLFTGGMIQLVVAGHCSDLWMGRLRRMKGTNDYLDDRLSSLISNHYLLRASHEEMEKEMVGRPVTLRSAVAHLREHIHASEDKHGFPGAQQLLEYAATVCSVDQAAIFRVIGDDVHPIAIAAIGNDFPLVPDDSLLVASLESQQLTHLRTPDTEHSEYIACVPIIAIEQGLIAVLVVRSMPFLAVNTDNLQLLRTLSNYFVDGLSHASLVRGIQQHVRECPDEFALELARVARMANEAGIPSTLIAFHFPLDSGFESAADILHSERGTLDFTWTHASGKALTVVMLLPLTDTLAAHRYRLRIQHQCETKLGIDLDGTEVCVETVAVPAEAPGLALYRLLNRAHHE